MQHRHCSKKQSPCGCDCRKAKSFTVHWVVDVFPWMLAFFFFFYICFMIVFLLGHVWKCSYSCLSKYFSCWNTLKWCFFYFLKIIFKISTSKRIKIYKKNLIFNKKKKFKIFKNTDWYAFPNAPLMLFKWAIVT
jgi:hypothetical protein